MQWKMFWPIFGSSLSVAAAVIPTIYGVKWWITAVAIGTAGFIILASIGQVTRNTDMFHELPDRKIDRITALIRIAALAFIVWTLVFVCVPTFWIALSIAMPIICIATYWGCRGEEYWISRPKKKIVETNVVEVARINSVEDNPTVKKFRPILTKAGHPGVRIISSEEITDPDTGSQIARQLLVQTPATGK
jgi:hypothetical protein